MTTDRSKTWLAANACLVALLATTIVVIAFEVKRPLSSVWDDDGADRDVQPAVGAPDLTAESAPEPKENKELEAAWQKWSDLRGDVEKLRNLGRDMGRRLKSLEARSRRDTAPAEDE